MTARPTVSGLRARRNAVVVLFALGGVVISAWGPRLPAIAAGLRVDTAAIGVVLTLLTVGSIAGLAASSPVAARVGYRVGLTGATTATAAGLVVLALGVAATSLPTVGAGFLAIGFGIGLLDVLMNVEGAAVEAEAGRTLLPLMHGAWSVGAVIGSGIGAACAFLRIAPGVQFAGEAVLVAAAGVVCSRFIPSGAPAVPEPDADDRPRRIRLGAWLRRWLDPRLLLVGVVMFGVEIGEGTANNWLALSGERDLRLDVSSAALLLVVFAVAESLARIFGGPVVDRIGRVRIIRITTALGVVGLVAYYFTGVPVVAGAGVVLWAVGVSMGFPLGMSAAAEGGPGAAGRVSVAASIGYLANLGGPPIIGFLAAGVGLRGSFLLPAALLVAAFLAAGALRPREGIRP